MINFCSHCGKKFEVGREYIGVKTSCPFCGKEIVVEDSETNLVTCSDCGGKISKHAASCPRCGSPVMLSGLIPCSMCGAPIAKNARMCPRCGAPGKAPLLSASGIISVVLFLLSLLLIAAGVASNNNFEMMGAFLAAVWLLLLAVLVKL